MVASDVLQALTEAAAGRPPAIAVSDLRRRFGEVEGVQGVTFEVGEGEIFGFLGPNGAGKTTTINILCTLLRPSGGQATVNGFDVVRDRSHVRRSIGLVFQQSTLDESLSAERNLRFHAYAYGIPAEDREPRIRELLTLVELWDRRRSRVRTFSGGMKRRLEIARGLLTVRACSSSTSQRSGLILRRAGASGSTSQRYARARG